MTADTLLHTLRERNIGVTVDGDNLRLARGRRLPPELLAEVRTYKTELIELLREAEPDTEPPPRQKCIRCRKRPALGTEESPRWCGECVEEDRRICRAEGLLHDGICCACHVAPATHPNPDGYAGPKGSPRGHVRQSAPYWYREKYPPRYCDACWESGRWKEGLTLMGEPDA